MSSQKAFVFALVSATTFLFPQMTHWDGVQARAEEQEAKPFRFPTSENDASFRFTSFPDLFNWNIKYPQPGWEEAVDWFLIGMKKEGPAFSLNAGDVMDARWWSNKEEVRRQTNEYWGGFRKRFDDKDIDLYIAPGDHEYGDDQGLLKMDLAPVFAEQFAKIFDMPRNGPAHKKGLAYSFAKGNLAVISVDTFEDAGNRMSITVSGKQLQWLEDQLRKYQDKQFIIVQGHVPVVGPVKSKNSSANMLEGGVQSAFWKMMVKYGVDVYFCGEHHRITVTQRDGIWQVVHGALWGTQTDLNYLRGSVWPDRLELELFRFDVQYGGKPLTKQHPHRGNRGPWSKVKISESTKKNGPLSLGKLVIKAGSDRNRTTLATGKFGEGSASDSRDSARAPGDLPAHGDGIEVITPKKVVRFFQDDKIKGLYTWLQRSRYEDPNNVLTIKDGILHFTGNGNGYLCTKKHYRNFHLTVEYRWGERTYGDRKTLARSSGVFLHGHSPDGAYEGQYMAGLECQIIEGGTGDLELLPGNNADGSQIPQSVSITVETAEHPDYAGQPTWKKGGKRITLADRHGYRVSWFNHDLEWKNVTGYQPKNDLASPGKKWTKLDIISDGDHVKYYVNGVLANEAFDVKPSSGKISLQVEGAEMDFRNFELHPLDK